ncbi:hypothetical protein JD276_15320 [Leucobacter sp. CSA1]|uniref:DUF1023 domain-containing protein n=1 Tax=Leucobacter chromiisoli TaxID=2796471 RepID=A0A934Q9R3_9MICO|nr:alpha/beta hydrolase [Leucobacter chromiisoli]MBK0420398.1 hypothetical protein [Leucobacter chromiisoli]
MNSLDETSVGRLIEVSDGSRHGIRLSVAQGIAGELRGVSSAWAGARHHPLLQQLLGSASGELVWTTPPDADLVAAAWSGLSDEERATLIREVPWVIGNLPGLPYSVRDEANRRTFEFYSVHREELSADCQVALQELRRILDTDSGKPPIQLVALHLDGMVPLVAVGYGDLDAAEHVTWEVPGMNNDAHQALAGWDTASRNLYAQQVALLRASADSAEEVGLVAFLGYDTPNAVTVLGPGAARAGAERLAAELDGAHAARSSDGPLPHLGVLAHSYGTPVAANALLLATHPARSFTMIGSAGLDGGRLSDLSELRVGRDRAGRPKIYTAMAEGDLLAPLGSQLSGRLQPNPEAAGSAALSIGGAYAFSVEGTGALKATDGHSIIGRGERGAGGTNASAGHGYLDRGTHSLHNAAAISVDRLDLVEGDLVQTEQRPPLPQEQLDRSYGWR